jgi:hypothetical protein
VTWRRDALPVEPDVTGLNQRGGRTARAHHAGVPQPFVDALAIWSFDQVALLGAPFGAVLELLLESGEFCKG